MTHSTDGSQLEFEEVRAILDTYFATGDLQRALEEADAEDLSVRRLFDVVSESGRARAYFDRLAVAARAVSGPSDLEAIEEPSAFEREFGRAAFDEKLDEVLGETSTQFDGGEAVDPSAFGGDDDPAVHGGDAVAPETESDEAATVVELFGAGKAATLAAAASAALVAGVVFYQFGPGSGATDDPFQPRSAASTDEGPNFAEPDLELFCARSSDDGLEITGTDKIEDRLRCPVDAELKLGYRNRSPNLAYAAFFGVDESGSIYWYGPSPAAPAPVAVDDGRVVEPIGETIRLNVNHEPGPVRVHAVLSPDPIDHAELARRLERKSDRELWRSRHLEFAEMPSASTSTVFRVVEAETGNEEAR